MKKRYFIPLMLVLGFTVAVALDDSHEDMRIDCVIQDKQVVINRYDNEHLITSTSFNNTGFKYWHKGSNKVVKENYNMPYFDYWPMDEGQVIFKFANDIYRTRYYNEWHVSRSCYDAVLEVRHTR